MHRPAWYPSCSGLRRSEQQLLMQTSLVKWGFAMDAAEGRSGCIHGSNQRETVNMTVFQKSGVD